MAEWTHLPKDLMELISKRLDTSTDLLRFRSVCNSWRSSIPPEPPCLSPNTFKILPNDGISHTSFGFSLFKRTVFLVGLPNSHNQTDTQGWLIKIEEDVPGRTVVVAMDTNLGLVGNPVFGGDKKYLVESRGDLLLVDMYLSIDSDEGLSIGHDVVQDLVQYMSERTVWFKVFKLNEEGKCWIEVNDLEDRVLFLGDDLTFSASASELSGCKGNCIFFNDDFFYSRGEGDDGSLFGRDIGVFELESGCIGPLRNFPDYSKMFWPPPDWVASTSLEVSLHPPSITVYMKFQFYLRMLALSYLDFAIYFHRSLNLFVNATGAESKSTGRAVYSEVKSRFPIS
ncbi:hypothetical protein H0E87_008135 [Populus deltoides]|uniref:F-box domain-containing protein n=1 Tax=Populus deltoides TaxID=3696 RepID=A0A8T2YZ86_POPDE|nr:hypothetical protein H0E87_008135 [Populus deltoides]